MTVAARWKRAALREVAHVVTGRTPSPAVQAYWHGALPFVTPGDLTYPSFEGDAARSLSDSGRRIARVIPPASTLVTCIGSSVGKMALSMVECTTNQQINAITARSGVDPYFLHYTLEFNAGRIRKLAGNTAVPLVTKSQLSQFTVLLPPLAFQRRIGTILRTCDMTTRAVSALVGRKRAFKRALMNDLLTGRRRFPEFAGRPWETRRLGDLFAERNETGFADLPLLSVTADLGIIPREEVGRKDTSNADKSKYKRVLAGDIAYNTMRMWQGVSALSALEGIVSPAYTVVSARGPMRADYAKHLFKLPRQVHEFLRRSQGLVDDTLNLKYPNFARVTVSFPESLEEQGAIVEVLDRVDQEIELLAECMNQVAALKRGLMQRLLSGEIEIPEHLTAATAAAEAGDDDS